MIWDLTKMKGSQALQAVPYQNVVTTDSIIEKYPRHDRSPSSTPCTLPSSPYSQDCL